MTFIYHAIRVTQLIEIFFFFTFIPFLLILESTSLFFRYLVYIILGKANCVLYRKKQSAKYYIMPKKTGAFKPNVTYVLLVVVKLTLAEDRRSPSTI